MCFHSKQSKTAQQIENRFDAKFEDIKLFQPSSHYNGFEFPKTPIITKEDASTIQMINWGLKPAWAKENFDRKNTLNARLETLKEKPSFKNILENRCIILVNGFYEWKHIGKQKIKYEIGFNEELFAFAGLYDLHEDIKTYTIITTEAKGIMQEIHNTKLRIPYSLTTDKDFNDWLNGKEIAPKYGFSAIQLDPIQGTLF